MRGLKTSVSLLNDNKGLFNLMYNSCLDYVFVKEFESKFCYTGGEVFFIKQYKGVNNLKGNIKQYYRLCDLQRLIRKSLSVKILHTKKRIGAKKIMDTYGKQWVLIDIFEGVRKYNILWGMDKHQAKTELYIQWEEKIDIEQYIYINSTSNNNNRYYIGYYDIVKNINKEYEPNFDIVYDDLYSIKEILLTIE